MLKAVGFIFSLFFFYLILSIPIKDKRRVFDYIDDFMKPQIESTFKNVKNIFQPKFKSKIPYYTNKVKEEIDKEIDPIADQIKETAKTAPNKKEFILSEIKKLKGFINTTLEPEEKPVAKDAEPAPKASPKVQTKSDTFTDYDYRN